MKNLERIMNNFMENDNRITKNEENGYINYFFNGEKFISFAVKEEVNNEITKAISISLLLLTDEKYCNNKFLRSKEFKERLGEDDFVVSIKNKVIAEIGYYKIRKFNNNLSLLDDKLNNILIIKNCKKFTEMIENIYHDIMELL